MAAGTNFEGDRGANRLLNNNERELVPYFLEDTNGQQVVNEALKMQQQSRGGKSKGIQQSFNQKAAAANKATPSRPFAVQQGGAAPKPAAKHDKWAGGAFLNCPAPSALPIPLIAMPEGEPAHAAAAGGAVPSFLDPAIVTSSSQQMAAGGAHRPGPLLPPGSRVNAQFLDNEWYDGVVCGSFSGGHLILFDGFESEGAYEIAFHLIRPHVNPPHQHTPGDSFPAPGQAAYEHRQLVQAPGRAPAGPEAGPPPTSLADLEKQLLATPPPARDTDASRNLLALLQHPQQHHQHPHHQPLPPPAPSAAPLPGAAPASCRGRAAARGEQGAGIVALLGQAPPAAAVPLAPPAGRADANAGGNIMAMLGQMLPPHPGVQLPHAMQQPAPAARAHGNAGGNIMAMLGQVPPPQRAIPPPHLMEQHVIKQPNPPPAARADANAGGNIMAMLGQVPPQQPAVQAPHVMQQLLQPQPQQQPPRAAAAAGDNAGSNILAMLGQQGSFAQQAHQHMQHQQGHHPHTQAPPPLPQPLPQQQQRPLPTVTAGEATVGVDAELLELLRATQGPTGASPAPAVRPHPSHPAAAPSAHSGSFAPPQCSFAQPQHPSAAQSPQTPLQGSFAQPPPPEGAYAPSNKDKGVALPVSLQAHALPARKPASSLLAAAMVR